MKKTFLTSIAALFLTTGTAHADSNELYCQKHFSPGKNYDACLRAPESMTGRRELPPLAVPIPPILRPPRAHARASLLETYECGATKPLEYEKDPIVKIKIFVGISARDGDVRIFDVDHYAASGAVYSRKEQYYNRRLSTVHDKVIWTGTWVKNPKQTMIGELDGEFQYARSDLWAVRCRASPRAHVAS